MLPHKTNFLPLTYGLALCAMLLPAQAILLAAPLQQANSAPSASASLSGRALPSESAKYPNSPNYPPSSSSTSPGTSAPRVRAAPGEEHWEAGSVSAMDSGQFEHTFTFKNSGKSPLTISRLQTSCGCTSAEAATDKGPVSLPQTLAPGQSLLIHARVNLGVVTPGPLSKSVTLYSDASPRPVAVLEVAGTLRPSLALSPALLDFGQITGGQASALTVTATWDERLTPGGSLPVLMSTNPDISVTPQPETEVMIPKVPGPSPFLHRGTRTRTYRVLVSPTAVLGPISGMLSFQPSKSSGGLSKKGLDQSVLRAAIYSQSTALLLGQVQGDLTAQPQALTFSRVRQGQPASREIVLTGVRLETLKSLSVATASPWLTAHFSPATPVFSGGQLQATSQVLDVSLSPNTPPGLLASTLKITLANGQHLRIPVIADVSSVGL